MSVRFPTKVKVVGSTSSDFYLLKVIFKTKVLSEHENAWEVVILSLSMTYMIGENGPMK